MNSFGEKKAWTYPGTAQFFRAPPIISGTAKAAIFEFCTHIYRLNRNKSPLNISGKVAVHGSSKGLPKIFRAPIAYISYDIAHRAVHLRSIIIATVKITLYVINQQCTDRTEHTIRPYTILHKKSPQKATLCRCRRLAARCCICQCAGSRLFTHGHVQPPATPRIHFAGAISLSLPVFIATNEIRIDNKHV